MLQFQLRNVLIALRWPGFHPSRAITAYEGPGLILRAYWGGSTSTTIVPPNGNTLVVKIALFMEPTPPLFAAIPGSPRVSPAGVGYIQA